MSLKMKLTSAIIMFMLAIATLVIGVLAAQTQSINMEGTINFEISDRSLYVKNVRLEDSDGTTTITSFMPGYINDGITLSLGTHTVSNTSFKIHFDLINTTSNTYEAGDVTLSSELQSANVIASASGMIEPTTEDIPDGESYAPITSTTPISGTITLSINSPNTTSIDLSGITVAVDEYVAQIIEGFSFSDGVVTDYFGQETDIIIPSSYSVIETDSHAVTFNFGSKTALLNYYNMNENNMIRLAVGNYTIYKSNNGAIKVPVKESPDITEIEALQEGDFPVTIEYTDFTLLSSNIPSTGGADALFNYCFPSWLDLCSGRISYLTYTTQDGLSGEQSFTFTKADILAIESASEEELAQNSFWQLVLILETDYTQLFPLNVQYGNVLQYVEGDDVTVSGIGLTLGMFSSYLGLSNTQLTSVVLPQSIAYINEGAFAGCTSLTTATIESETIYQGATDTSSTTLGGLLSNVTRVIVPTTIVSAYQNDYLTSLVNYPYTWNEDTYTVFSKTAQSQ